MEMQEMLEQLLLSVSCVDQILSGFLDSNMGKRWLKTVNVQVIPPQVALAEVRTIINKVK